jgi:hypothetical protein
MTQKPEYVHIVPVPLEMAFVPLEADALKLSYQRLKQYLRTKQWKEADEETNFLMLIIVGKAKRIWFSELNEYEYSIDHFDADDLRNFPSDDLLAINHLWLEHSNGLYGFSVQKQIYVECGGKLDFSHPSNRTWDKFSDLVAWDINGNKSPLISGYKVPLISDYYDIEFLEKLGHLPFFWALLKTCGSRCIRRHEVWVNLLAHPDL